ncbi:MAG: SpoIVB peptidase S55 domain-containing protein [Polyangiaceae bacterium]|nr:SpoIVB peptidase S55 domain-containing protein [Polyangiaceae bacterium]
MRFSNILALAALAGLTIPLPLGLGAAHADGVADRRDVLSVKDIRPGMKGYGLTVFSGMKPERFDVEVIGILDNFQPRQDLILIKTKHPRLEVAKVVAGMSGSPIFINGKMIGAYAYGWSFGSEPVAGVTPIRNMLDDLAIPLPKSIFGWPLKALPGAQKDPKQAQVDPGQRFLGDLMRYSVQEHSDQIRRDLPGNGAHAALTPVATPLLLGGMSPAGVSLMSKLFAPIGLEPLQAGGGGAPDPQAPTRFEDGGAIGVNLISGDMSAMGLGTVTRVEGDKLVAFGHPMMQSGVTSIPTSLAKVLWFLASDQRSFKLGAAVRPLGALVNDRLASIVVDQSARAPTIAVDLQIQGVAGPSYTNWKFQVAHEKFMAPSLIATALGSAFQATAAERRDVSWSAKGRVRVKGYGNIELEDFGVAMGGTPDAMELMGSNAVRTVGALLNNPWEPALVEAISMQMEIRYAREVLRLRGVENLTPEVPAGGTARLRLTLLPYAGPEVVRTISVPIPAYFAGQAVTLTVAPGHQVERDLAAPENVRELVANLRVPIYPPKSVIVSYENQGSGVSYRSHVADNLPPGAVDRLQPTSTSLGPARHQPYVRQVVPMQDYMIGQDSVSVDVKPVLK